MHQQTLPILSRCTKFNVSTSNSVTSVPSSFVSMNKITPCLTDLLHQDSLNGSEKHRGTPLFCAHLLCAASAAMRGCSPLLKLASGEDGTPSHGSVTARPIEQQRETQGRSPFLRARSRYATCMSAGLRVRGDARMLDPAKPHNGLGWDLVSQDDCIAKLRIIE